jgi:hypothetical protein
MEINWVTLEPVGKTLIGQNRVGRAWQNLAPEGPELPERQRRLQKLVRDLIRRRDADFATRVHRTIQSSQFLWMIDGIERPKKRQRAELVEDISALKKHLLKAVRQRLTSRMVLENVRPEDSKVPVALASLAHDPLLKIEPYPPAVRGNPKQTRNMLLRQALLSHSLTDQIAAVLSAIGFTGTL